MMYNFPFELEIVGENNLSNVKDLHVSNNIGHIKIEHLNRDN